MVRLYITIVLSFTCSFLYGQVNDSISNDELITFIETPPLFKGDLCHFIKEHLNYPNRAKNDSLEGTVIISYWVDTSGITIEHHVIRSLRKDLDEEALRVTKLIRYEKPAIQRGKPIKVKYTVPVEFKLFEGNKKSKCKKQ